MMALHRPSQPARQGSKNDNDKEEEDTENNGYIQIFVKPLEQGNYGFFLSWFGLSNTNFSSHQLGALYGVGVLLTSAVFYQLLRCDVGLLFQRLCGLVVPMFSILCAFYWLSLYFRRTWSTTSVYLLFSSCYLGETLAQVFLRDWGASHPSDLTPQASVTINSVTQPLVIVFVLLAISIASVFSSLETIHSAVVILLVSFTRFLACSALADLPQGIRPYVAYTCGFAGILVAKYMETVLKPPIQNFMTQDGKIPVIKRRRSSSSSAHAFSAHRSARRTSLPALIQKSQWMDSYGIWRKSSSVGYESAIIGEAHGLINDMLADTNLPPHIVSGLRVVSSLLKPPESHSGIHKPKVSPLVSLTESTSYGSDSEESPYTGERPSSLPKRLRRSLPPSLIRRMSTSTWTTTTSATGMPTLEPEPCRIRSASFRHSREGTPGSSPNGSRSNSPSPSSNTTVVLTIPKSRSFSLASAPTSQSHPRTRFMRRSMVATSSESAISPTKAESKGLSPLVKSDVQDDGDRAKVSALSKELQCSAFSKRFNITSDYESSDSPSSSDHSDNVGTNEELVGSPPKKQEVLRSPVETKTKTEERVPDPEGNEAVEAPEEEKSQVDGSTENKLLFEVSEVEEAPLLQISRLNDWDFPVFDLADSAGEFVLSKVAYKLFMEVGLFETFRIPLAEFINYFHDLELGYRIKPYHNRVHATDVLHGVYFLSTQPIPGFTQVTTGDILSRHGSSKSDNCDRTGIIHRQSFAAEDSYGIMGGNFPALELMAMYTAAAMHDYDHPGRTNAFLVATNAPQAVLYNDRSVLENHHAASAWRIFLTKPQNHFLSGLDAAEFKRFRFLVIEAILATDLKRHFEILAEFNTKVNDEDASGIDWTQETDRLLVMQMVIKLADINGPAKKQDLHMRWTMSIAEEFYEQGDEEARLGMPISPYMDRTNPQLAKLQETFINHLVAPLCNAMVMGGLLPGTWVEEDSDGESLSDTDKGESTCKDTEDETETDQESGGGLVVPAKRKKTRKVNCIFTKNMKDNYDYWMIKLREEEAERMANEVDMSQTSMQPDMLNEKSEIKEMESIKEESESPPPTATLPQTGKTFDETKQSSDKT
ncbi:cGMP-inhibited 3',5'-cyclic phosphodiesterase 3A-like isoform X2 [Haliotis cracherodii]|uniref:cGMP-inhibited 3',5'-cyclic phosphodiesterase 3A-like isoform X2 n=1 Tax=Haliotis cracherodii TaxID=6455 RepID=UPI0039E7C31F